MRATAQGTVWINETVTTDAQGGRILTARFSASHQVDGGLAGELVDVSLDQALDWARERATRISIVDGDGTRLSTAEHPAAGEQRFDRHAFDARPRRPTGQAWRDRSDDDPEITWRVYLELRQMSPIAPGGVEAAKAVIAEDENSAVTLERLDDIDEWSLFPHIHSSPMDPDALLCLTTEVRASSAVRAAEAARATYADDRWSTFVAVQPFNGETGSA